METISDPFRTAVRRSRAGSSLLIVLTFVVLLTVLILAFFSRSILEEQVSNSSANQVKVDNFATGAVASIISDLKQEIEAGSSVTTPIAANTYLNYYSPTASSGAYPTMLPAVTGSPTGPAPGATFGSYSLGAGPYTNLIKISLHASGTTLFYPKTAPYSTTPTDPNRVPTTSPCSTGASGDTTASVASGSVDGTSLNGRYVTGARWNKPLLIPPTYNGNPTVFPLPDWIYAYRSPTSLSANPTTFNANILYSPANLTTTTVVLGRYAYAIYDEGGLLDVNVAGTPTPLAPGAAVSSLSAYKSSEAMADLTQIPGLTQTLADTIIGWRNNATAAQWQGTTTSTALTGNVNSGYTWNSTNATNYFYNVLCNPTGFLRPVSTGTSTAALAQSDQFFTSRQQLLQFFNNVLGGGNTVNGALQYLTTFSRAINQPSYQPDPTRPTVLALTSGGNDKGGGTEDNIGTGNVGTILKTTVNPSFLSVRVGMFSGPSSFTRNDGSTAYAGDPLVKKRFALNRLAWLTYLGPIADDSGLLFTNSASAVYVGTTNLTNAQTILSQLENMYGFSPTFLSQGGPTNIQKYFGLVWVQDSSTTIGINDGTYKWKYEHGSKVSGNGVAGNTTTPGLICTLGYVAAAGRDPDFFELLKASIAVGSIAKIATTGAVTTPGGYQAQKDESVDGNIIQIGANIINQFNTDSYSRRILFDDGSWSTPQEFRGVVDLPYLYRLRGNNLKLADSNPAETTSMQSTTGASTPTGYTSSNTGTGTFLETPEIFDPYAWNPNATVSALRPTNFKVVILSSNPASINAGLSDSSNTTSPIAYSRNNGLGEADYATNPGEPTASTLDGEALTFTIPTSTNAGAISWFREPTLLNKPDATGRASKEAGPPIGCQLQATGASSPGGYTSSAGSGFLSSYYQADAYSSATDTNVVATASISGTFDNQKYLGFNFGTVPLLFPSSSGTKTSPILATTNLTVTGAVQFGGNTNFTYQLQYLDPVGGTKYITYDEKFLPLSYCPPGGGGQGLNTNVNTFLSGPANGIPWTLHNPTGGTGPSNTDDQLYDVVNYDQYECVLDPRSARFSANVFTGAQTGGEFYAPPLSYHSILFWLDASQNYLMTARPDYCVGWDCISPTAALGFYNIPTNNSYSGMSPVLSQNVLTPTYTANVTLASFGGQGTTPSGYTGPEYYADADGVVRRATAGYSAAPASPKSTTVPPSAYNGLPLQTSTTFASGTGTATPITYSSRPVMLNRPFRSVADLGYVFSGIPWRNIDFSTPESGYSALLDVFCINDTDDPSGLVAGKVNLNTRQAPVLEAILNGAYKDEFNPGTTQISSGDATKLITDTTNGLLTRTTSTSSGKGPLTNIGDLVGKWIANTTTTAPVNGTTAYSGFSGDLNSISTTDTSAPYTYQVQRYREAAIRALANSGQTRVWNLMIDVIAQTGRFPSSATSLSNFIVEGEQRYWVHIAIDRYTGQVLDQQIEVVKE